MKPRHPQWLLKTIRASLPLLSIASLLGPVCRDAAENELGAAKPKSADLPWEKGAISVGGQLAALDSTLSPGVETLNAKAVAKFPAVIMILVVNQQGRVHQKSPGVRTGTRVLALAASDPAPGWSPDPD